MTSCKSGSDVIVESIVKSRKSGSDVIVERIVTS